MRKANVLVDNILAGELQELTQRNHYRFIYREEYQGIPVSLTMPIVQRIYEFDRFPPFFEGLLPEGFMLESLLKRSKIDRNDFMTQMITVGHDLVGNVTVEAVE